MRNKLATIVLSIIITGCTGDALVHHYEHTSPEGWDRKDTLYFDIPPVERPGYYKLSLGLRAKNNFPYEDLWIAVDTKMETPTFVKKDTMNFVVTSNDGKMKGTGIHNMQMRQTVGLVKLETGQTGQIRLYHVMTKEVIPDITDVGLMLEPVTSSVDTQKDK